MEERKLTSREIRAWLSAVDADLESLGAKLEPLLAEQRRLEERRMLLESLLRSFNTTDQNGATTSAAGRASGSVARYVIERAIEILRDEGHPLHINDLHALFVERGFTVPGAGKPVNLIVHLRAAEEEIVSPARGIYGLVDQVGSVAQHGGPSKRRKRARARTRARKS